MWEGIRMIGRNITSQGARLWHMELAPYETAWELFMQSSNFVCVEHIADRANYKQLKRFYMWFTRMTVDELVVLLKKYSPLVSFDYGHTNLNEESFMRDLLTYSKPAVEASFRHFNKKKIRSISPELFIDQCREEYFSKIDSECPEDSSWANRLPVIEVQTTTECPHHKDKAYCYMMAYERDSDNSIDPIRQETFENIIYWEQQMEEDFELG